MNKPDSKLDLAALVLANVLILGIMGFAYFLDKSYADLYYRSVQEDELMEWATFWAFLMAAAVGVWAALAQRRATGRFPWFLLGVSLFSFVVAMEEISWAQRVFGYRPPVYFLEHNFQQEFNFHNVASTDLRKLAVKAVLLGYGVLLPALSLLAPLRRGLNRLGVIAPPVALIPSFLAAYLFYEDYELRFTGEWVELMMGLGFLFALLAPLYHYAAPLRARVTRPVVLVLGAALLCLALGAAGGAFSRSQRGGDAEILAAAQAELEALKRDFLSGRVRTKCNNHKRLYSWLEKYDQDYLLEGEFARLVDQGLPEERAAFFLDPWNYAYWIRDRCDKKTGKRVVFLYSFGPNRRRESSRWEILGDDVGTVVYQQGMDR